MARPKIFVSFDFENDRSYKYTLNMWNVNSSFEFTCNDKSPNEIQSWNIPTIKAVLSRKINEATHMTLTPWQGTIEGCMKIVIFVVYMLFVSQMKDIKRLFKYHGAEHKSIACYEAGEELTVENVKKCTRFHPRCGTSFMFVMLILSIVVVTLLSLFVPAELKQNTIAWMFIKLPLIPLIMGIGYEFIRYAGKHDNLFVKIVSAPGLWMQRITTKEPEDDIIEVGIASIKAVITDNIEDDEIKR